MRQSSTRWRGAVAATILLAAVGLVIRSGGLVLAAIVPLVYVAFGLVASGPAEPTLRVKRHIDPPLSPPGTPVAVTLTVENAGERTLSDLRIVDAVPADLAVTRGSPRSGTTLQPGEVATIEYELVARRGVHDFESPQVRLRGLGGTSVRTVRPPVEGDREVFCRLDAEAPPLDDQGAQYAGQLTTDEPGEGLTFHSTREYRRGDDASRINWRNYAKRNELATVEYERRLAASVVVVLDARQVSRVTPGPGRPTAVELSAYAATHAVRDLLGAGHEVGVAVIGTDGSGPAGLHWLPPTSGEKQRSLATEAFRAAVETTETAADTDRQLTELLGLVPPGAQLALCSPLLDDWPVEAVTTWRSQGYPAVVLSPDVVTDNTVSGQFEQVQRHTRLARCQAAGGRAMDWRRGTPLPLALEYTFAAAARLPSPGRASVDGGSP